MQSERTHPASSSDQSSSTRTTNRNTTTNTPIAVQGKARSRRTHKPSNEDIRPAKKERSCKPMPNWSQSRSETTHLFMTVST